MTTSDETGTFCHDHIEHPLMWCDDKRRLVERKNAEESIRMWRRRKAEEMARKEKEKQEYYELFVKHCPWGRPGGGAPNMDVRRKDITAIGLHSTDPVITQTSGHRLTSLQPSCRYSDYFLSKHKRCLDPVAVYQPHLHHQHHHHHHSVPRVTATTHHHHHSLHNLHENTRPLPGAVAVGGSSLAMCERDLTTSNNATAPGGKNKNAESLQITLKDHPSMSYRNKGHVDIEVRYKPTAANKGKPLLQKIVVTESDKCPLVDIQPPSCLAGKGTKIDLKVAKAKKALENMEKAPCKEPWGKPGPGGKPWRSPKAVGSTFMKSLGWTNKEMLKELDQDNPATPAEKQTFRKPRAGKKPTKCCDVCTCNCPAVNQIKSSPLKPLQKQVLTKQFLEAKQKICPRLLRHSTKAVSTPHIDSVTCTDNSANMTSTATPSTAAATHGNGVELVPLLARRRAYNRPISLSSTDVTKRADSHDRLHTADAALMSSDYLHYAHELNKQVTQKRRSICMAQQLDKELSIEHFKAMDAFWGRPGNGAPGGTRRKLKLDNLLYGTSDCELEIM